MSMFIVRREFGSERITTYVIPYESKIICGLARISSIVFIMVLYIYIC